MVSVAYTYNDVLPPARTVARSAAVLDRREAVSDPLVDSAARLLSAPLHQVYALLWRAGWLTVQ